MDEPRLVKFDWSVQYAECDLAPKHLESKPVLTLYLGAQFVRNPETGGVVNIPLDEDHLAKEYKGTLVGSLRRDQGSVIPVRAPIGIASAALHRNDTGTPCYVDVGSSIALIGDVLAEIKQRGYYEHAHELLMRNSMLQGDEHIRKGVIKLRINAFQMGNAVKMPSQLPAVGSQSLVLERIAATQAREDTVAAYVQATMQHEMGFPDSLPNIGRVRVPMDISETGALLTGHSYLPIAAYAMVETPVANADFFVNAFERVMARANLAGTKNPFIGAKAAGTDLSTQAIAAYNAMDTRGKAQVMGRILGYGVQSMDYIGDAREPSNRRNLVTDLPVKIANENMEQGWLRLAGDCEDFASALVATNHAWIGARFNAANPKHRPLMEMQAMLAEYIATPALSIVHGAKIGDEEGYGAHMYTPMFPRRKFMEALGRTSDGRALLTRMKPVDRVPNTLVAAEAQNGAAAKRGWNIDELPSMTLEGTGILSPLPTIEVVPQKANDELIGAAASAGPVVGILDPIFAQRRKVAAGMPSLRGMKTEIPHFRYNNPFYMAITNVISDHFWKREGIPVAGFVVGQTAPAGSNAEMTRGIMYEDFLSNSSKLAIAPQPFIPQSVQSVIVEANSARPPIRAHVLDWTKPLAGKPKDPLLDRFVAGVAAFKRDAPPPHLAPANSVDFIVKPHQYNAAKIGDWLKDAASFSDLYHVSYELEHITNEVYTYRLRLWVK